MDEDYKDHLIKDLPEVSQVPCDRKCRNCYKKDLTHCNGLVATMPPSMDEQIKRGEY